MRKTIVIGVIILIIIFLLKVIPIAFHPQVTPTNTQPTKQVKADATEANIKISAISFYEEYNDCINDQSQTVNSCLKKNTSASTQLMKDNEVPNPICGEQLPDSYSVNKITTKDTMSTVEVIESIGGTKHTILLLLGNESNKWKVQKISCPKI